LNASRTTGAVRDLVARRSMSAEKRVRGRMSRLSRWASSTMDARLAPGADWEHKGAVNGVERR
jgi:hypothetical protein